MVTYSKLYPLEYNTIKESILKLRDIDNCNNETHVDVLDIFDHCLSEEETDQWNFSYREHHLRYESRYLEFMSELFLMNKSKVILAFDYKNLEVNELINIIEGLDQKERFDFLTLIKNQTFSLISHFYLIEDLELLRIVMMIMTRELLSGVSLYFVDIGMSISSGFDLSLPVRFINEESKGRIESIVKKHHLFIRS